MWITGIRVSYITLAQRICIDYLRSFCPTINHIMRARDIHLIACISISLYFEMTSILIPFWEGGTVLIVLYITVIIL